MSASVCWESQYQRTMWARQKTWDNCQGDWSTTLNNLNCLGGQYGKNYGTVEEDIHTIQSSTIAAWWIDVFFTHQAILVNFKKFRFTHNFSQQVHFLLVPRIKCQPELTVLRWWRYHNRTCPHVSTNRRCFSGCHCWARLIFLWQCSLHCTVAEL